MLSRAGRVYARAAARNEQSLGIVERSLEALAAERGRKSLVLVSGGLVQDPRLAGYRRVVTESRRANAAVYFLDARGLVRRAHRACRPRSGRRTEFRDLGLEAHRGARARRGQRGARRRHRRLRPEEQQRPRGGPRPHRPRVAQLLPPRLRAVRTAADGRFREDRGEGRPRGRHGARPARVLRPGGDDEAQGAAEARDAAIQRALDAPFDLPDVPLRAIAHVLGAAEPGKASVLLTVEADIRGLAFTEKGGTSRDTLEFLLLVARGTRASSPASTSSSR